MPKVPKIPIKSNTKKGNMLLALRKSLGIVTKAAKMVIEDELEAENLRQSHYYWLKTDTAYKEAVESIEGIVLDYAESQLFKQVAKGDTTAVIFLLKCKGKKRGYIDRAEMDLTTSVPQLVIHVDTEEHKRMIENL